MRCAFLLLLAATPALSGRDSEKGRFKPAGKVCGHAHQFFEVIESAEKGAKPKLRTPREVRSGWGGCTVIGIYGGVDTIGDDGAAAIARAIESEDVVEKLMLSEAGIGPRGAAALARALESSKTLKELWLGGNEVGDAGAASFGEALRANRHLRELLLYSNGVSDKGAKALAAALPDNYALHRLWLGVNECVGLCVRCAAAATAAPSPTSFAIFLCSSAPPHPFTSTATTTTHLLSSAHAAQHHGSRRARFRQGSADKRRQVAAEQRAARALADEQ